MSDFGLARDAKGNMGNYKLTSRVGTEGYKPPEMEVGNYTGLAADLFAAGVVLFIMFNGTPPFLSTKANDRIYQLIKTKNFPKFWALHEKNKQPNHFPDSFKRLINSLLSAEVDRRPEIDDIEKDEWVTGDDIMINDLITYMTEKANKLAQNDPNRKKLAELRQKMSEKCINKLIKVCKMRNAVDQEPNMMKNKQKVSVLKITAQEISEDIELQLKNSQFMR